MGREIKRVPANFVWPIDKIWAGFINPYEAFRQECEACGGDGYNEATREVRDTWYDESGFGSRWSYVYGIGPDGKSAIRQPWKIVGDCRRWCHSLTQDEVDALVDSDRLLDFTHHWKDGEWAINDPPTRPTAEAVNEWSKHGFGHDAINRIICVETRAVRLGVYGLCAVCDGKGDVFPTPKHRENYDAWEPEEVPTGDWWQVWETVSDGSPVTPPFATAEELVDYLVKHGDAWDQKRGDGGWRPEAAKDLISRGYAMTGISTPETGFLSPRDQDRLASAFAPVDA